MLESPGNLVSLLHSCPHRTHSGKDHYVSSLDSSLFDGANRFLLSYKYPCRSFLQINATLIDDAGIHRGAFYHRPLWRQIPAGENQGPRESLFSSSIRRKANIFRLHSILAAQYFSESSTAFAPLPPVQVLSERPSRGG